MLVTKLIQKYRRKNKKFQGLNWYITLFPLFQQEDTRNATIVVTPRLSPMKT
jgi:hypothetical protein